MAFLSRFYNSKNGDRTYDSADWADYFASFVGNGVFAQPASGCQVKADSGMKIKVSAGKLWINGYYSVNTSDYLLTLSAADKKPRYDRVVARLDLKKRTTILTIIKGTPASGLSLIANIPEITRNENIYDLSLAVIEVAAGTTKITQEYITDTRTDETVCGIVKGIIEQIDTKNLFAQYQAAFDAWFKNLTAELDENALTHLYTLIQSNYNSIRALNNQLVDDVTNEQYHLGVEDGKLYYEKGAIAVDSGFTALSSDKNYVHNQTAASAVWTINHNLGKYCSVTVVDSGGNIIVGNVEYVGINKLLIRFSSAVSGKAYCN